MTLRALPCWISWCHCSLGSEKPSVLCSGHTLSHAVTPPHTNLTGAPRLTSGQTVTVTCSELLCSYYAIFLPQAGKKGSVVKRVYCFSREPCCLGLVSSTHVVWNSKFYSRGPYTLFWPPHMVTVWMPWHYFEVASQCETFERSVFCVHHMTKFSAMNEGFTHLSVSTRDYGKSWEL